MHAQTKTQHRFKAGTQGKVILSELNRSSTAHLFREQECSVFGAAAEHGTIRLGQQAEEFGVVLAVGEHVNAQPMQQTSNVIVHATVHALWCWGGAGVNEAHILALH